MRFHSQTVQRYNYAVTNDTRVVQIEFLILGKDTASVLNQGTTGVYVVLHA